MLSYYASRLMARVEPDARKNLTPTRGVTTFWLFPTSPHHMKLVHQFIVHHDEVSLWGCATSPVSEVWDFPNGSGTECSFARGSGLLFLLVYGVLNVVNTRNLHNLNGVASFLPLAYSPLQTNL